MRPAGTDIGSPLTTIAMSAGGSVMIRGRGIAPNGRPTQPPPRARFKGAETLTPEARVCEGIDRLSSEGSGEAQ